MNPFKRQNKEIREFKLPAKMILFNGQVPQKGDIVQIDLGEVSMKKSRVEDLYFRMINGELVATVHMSYGYTNTIYAVSINTVTGMMLSYWYDKSKCNYNSKAFNLFNEDGTSIIQLSSKNINLGITGAFSSMVLSSNTKKLQVQYYDNNGELHYDNVSVLKAKNWTISEFDTVIDFPSIKGNYVTKEEALQNMPTNGTQLCTVTSERKEETEVTDKSQNKIMSPKKRLMKLPNDTFSYNELYQSIEGSDIHRINVIKGLIRSSHILKTGGSNHFIKSERFRSQKEQEPTLELTTEKIETTNEEIKQEKGTKDIEYKIFDTPVQFNRVSSYADYLKKVPDYFSRKDLMNEFNITLDQVRWVVYNLRKRNYITYCNDRDHFLKTEKYRKNDGSLSPQSVTKEEEKPVTVTPSQQEPQQLQAPIATVKPQPAKEDIAELGEKIGLVTVSIDIFSGDTNETRLQRLIDTYINNVKKFSI